MTTPIAREIICEALEAFFLPVRPGIIRGRGPSPSWKTPAKSGQPYELVIMGLAHGGNRRHRSLQANQVQLGTGAHPLGIDGKRAYGKEEVMNRAPAGRHRGVFDQARGQVPCCSKRSWRFLERKKKPLPKPPAEDEAVEIAGNGGYPGMQDPVGRRSRNKPTGGERAAGGCRICRNDREQRQRGPSKC